MATERTCIACKTKYFYCPDCSRADALKPTWHSEFCSEPCMALWSTLTKFGMNILSKSEAQEIISALDLKPIDAYVACVQRDYAKVMAEEKKPKRGTRITINHVDELADIESIAIEPIVEHSVDVVAVEPESHEVVFKEEE